MKVSLTELKAKNNFKKLIEIKEHINVLILKLVAFNSTKVLVIAF